MRFAYIQIMFCRIFRQNGRNLITQMLTTTFADATQKTRVLDHHDYWKHFGVYMGTLIGLDECFTIFCLVIAYAFSWILMWELINQLSFSIYYYLRFPTNESKLTSRLAYKEELGLAIFIHMYTWNKYNFDTAFSWSMYANTMLTSIRIAYFLFL